MDNNLYKYLIILFIIIILIIIFNINNIKKFLKKNKHNIYNLYLEFPLKYENKYFINYFEQVIKPYYKGNINRNLKFNNKININRTSKNEYSILSNELTKDILNDLSNKNISNKSLNILLKRLIPYIHLDGKSVNPDDFIYLDALNAPGNYFKFFHTDTEWNTFCDNHGFQIWILLEEDKKIKPRGNMFLLETDDVSIAKAIEIKEKNTKIIHNNLSLFKYNIVKKIKSLKDINPKIYYLDAKVGEVFIMNPLLFHCSDPIVKKSSRRALNIRFIYKPKNTLRICNNKNIYTNYVKNAVNFKCNYDYCDINNKNLKYDFI